MLHLVAADHQVQQVQPVLVLKNAPDGVSGLGGHDGGAHARAFQRLQRIRRAGKEGGAFDHQRPSGPLGLHPHRLLEGAEKGLLPLRVVVAGDKGVPVRQGQADGGPDLVHRGGVQPQGGEAQAVALGNRRGGVSQGVVKVEKYPLILHDMTSVILVGLLETVQGIIPQPGAVFNS